MTIPDDRIVELMLEVPEGQLLTYDMARLRSALGITDPTRLAIETDGGRHGILTIYPANPLAEVRPATRDDLLMDRRGYYTSGVYHNGRPVRSRLFDSTTGSAQRAMLFGTTGAGKSRALQLRLAAEKANGFVTWLCDLKDGQSVPEARDHVDWHGTTQEQAILILRAAVALIQERAARYGAMGRNAFLINDPDPLVSVWIDEANRLLEKGAPYRDEATYLIKEIGRTGRSVGVGVGIAAQAAHLEELGGSDTLRAMLKEGEVTLLRWSGSMMRQLVSDGLLPIGVQLMPIPKTLRQVRLTSQFDQADDEDDDDPTTAGCGYLLSGKHPASLMRHLRIGSMEPLPGLDPGILALYGPDQPARLEAASHDVAGEAYAARHDPAATAVLCAAVRHPDPEHAPTGAAETVTPTRPPATLESRVLAALTATGQPMTAEEILTAVLADEGREVKIGSIRNTLVALANADDSTIERAAHGQYIRVTHSGR